MLPIENQRIGPVRYRHRYQGRAVHAMRVQDVTIQAICDWVQGAHTWARSVVVPLPGGGEQAAQVGEWVYTSDGTTFSVLPDAEFRATYGPVTA